MSRLSPLTRAQLTPAQRTLYDGLTQGPRGPGIQAPDGSLVGPFNAMLHAPEVGDLVQQLGAVLRFRTSLPRPLIELAILVTAREWTAQFEWWAHARMAAEAGLDAAIIEAIRARREPSFANDDEALVYRLCRELLGDRRVSDGTYAAAVKLLGETGTVELVALQGYYGLVSMLLNTFEVPLPEGVAPIE